VARGAAVGPGGRFPREERDARSADAAVRPEGITFTFIYTSGAPTGPGPKGCVPHHGKTNDRIVDMVAEFRYPPSTLLSSVTMG